MKLPTNPILNVSPYITAYSLLEAHQDSFPKPPSPVQKSRALYRNAWFGRVQYSIV